MIVVADTGPINYLIWIECIRVLPELYTMVLIPPAVRDELLKPAAPADVRQWISSPPEWLEIRRPARAPDEDLMRVRIGPGERDAILLAEETAADALIVDDQRGRREAERRNLHALGTLGVLQVASRRSLLDLREALNRLRATSFYITDELIERIIAGTRP